jgi:choline-sulfatase
MSITNNKWLYHLASCVSLFLLISCSTNEDKGPGTTSKYIGEIAQESEGSKNSDVEILKRPNIIVILTDQERYPMHWPKGWAEKNLKATERLKRNGLSFQRAYTAACECTPSRGVLTTSEHYPVNKVSQTSPLTPLPSDKELIDIGWLLTEKAGYDVVWKGKWHLSLPEIGKFVWTKNDIENLKKKYDLAGWNPPDSGNAISEFELSSDGNVFSGLSTLGGGYANNDGRYLRGNLKDRPRETQGYGESILEYIKKVAAADPETRKPFCLFISLVNPHDIWVYPTLWEKSGYDDKDFANLGIGLPENYGDNLSTKPIVQRQTRDGYNEISPINDRKTEIGYVNFYAYLNKLADSHIEVVLNALDEAGLTDDTIIIRTADHGEAGLSHGMREKAFTAYEEMIHIPFVVSNPKMYPSPQTTDAFYCHLDLLPTLAELAKVPNYAQYGKGLSIVPVLKNPSASVQDSILFTYDDVFFLTLGAKRWHIRAIRDDDWTYAVYYLDDASQFEYEMYNNKKDPGQLVNLLYGKVSPKNLTEAKRLHAKLKTKIDHSSALPQGFAWPKAPLAS